MKEHSLYQTQGLTFSMKSFKGESFRTNLLYWNNSNSYSVLHFLIDFLTNDSFNMDAVVLIKSPMLEKFIFPIFF